MSESGDNETQYWEQNTYKLENEELLDEFQIENQDILEWTSVEEILSKRFGDDWTGLSQNTNYLPPILNDIFHGDVKKFNEFNRFLRFMDDHHKMFLQTILHIFTEYLEDKWNKLELLLDVVNRKQIEIFLANKHNMKIPQKNIFGIAQ